METTQHDWITLKYIFRGTLALFVFLHYDKFIGSIIIVFSTMAFAYYELSQIKIRTKHAFVDLIDGKEYSWVTNRPVSGKNKEDDLVTEEIIKLYESAGYLVRLLPYGVDFKQKIIFNSKIQSIWKRERDSGGGHRTKPDLGIRKSLKPPKPKTFSIQKARTKALQG